MHRKEIELLTKVCLTPRQWEALYSHSRFYQPNATGKEFLKISICRIYCFVHNLCMLQNLSPQCCCYQLCVFVTHFQGGSVSLILGQLPALFGIHATQLILLVALSGYLNRTK